MRKSIREGVTYLVVDFKMLHDFMETPERDHLNVIKVGRRILFGVGKEDGIYDGFASGPYNLLRWGPRVAVENANAVFGPKLIVKLLREGGMTKKFNSEFGERPVTFERDAKYVTFVAPCGQRGRFTVAEADKLADAIESL